MPIYLFSNPENDNDIVEVVMSVHDEHVFCKDGVKWNRVFTKPTASIDTKWNAHSQKDFIEKTGKKRGTLGEMWEKSEELSKQREKDLGQDPLKTKFYENYKKTHGNTDHSDIRKQKLKKKLNDNPKSMFKWED